MIGRIFLLLAVAFILSSCSRERHNQPQALDESAMRVMLMLFTEEIRNALNGYGLLVNALSEEAAQNIAQELVGIKGTASSSRLAEEYAANKTAADEKYKNKTLIITGKVRSIDKNVTGTPALQLNVGNIRQKVTSRFGKGSFDEFSALQKGEDVQLVCDIGSYEPGNIITDNCQSINHFVASKKDHLNLVMTDMLSGKNSIDDRLDFMMKMLYKLTLTLPAESACKVNLDKAECEREFQELPANKTREIFLNELSKLPEDKRNKIMEMMKKK